MASTKNVKLYLAHWFQLGKKLVLANGREMLLPKPVMEGGTYSQQFEECWQKVSDLEGKDCYLEGTDSTIATLLSPAWDIHPCARCGMPIARVELGLPSIVCPCNDLMHWPNLELPVPRSPVSTNSHLTRIKNRLNKFQLDS
ncbi:MAG: hypothetical protein QNJ70_03805 [Xenococcaceae cyanobacterium MO_207.B15]|nr:hypothetical protein [Xenococcaceae cyanobacterium MO_207.B15]MDJ0744122.1 hypothetical protein [Xenococcaceae cyanobacterium MO_167.B27]